jgi:hypothetical protein
MNQKWQKFGKKSEKIIEKMLKQVQHDENGLLCRWGTCNDG